MKDEWSKLKTKLVKNKNQAGQKPRAGEIGIKEAKAWVFREVLGW